MEIKPRITRDLLLGAGNLISNYFEFKAMRKGNLEHVRENLAKLSQTPGEILEREENPIKVKRQLLMLWQTLVEIMKHAFTDLGELFETFNAVEAKIKSMYSSQEVREFANTKKAQLGDVDHLLSAMT